MPLTHLSLIDRPREKLVRYGIGRLCDSELLALMLGTGSGGLDVMQLAQKLLLRHRSNLNSLSVEQLRTVRGIGISKAAVIVASFELSRRFSTAPPLPLSSGEAVWQTMATIRNSKKEHLVALYLDSHQSLILQEIVSVGTVDASIAHPREVFEPAIRHNASSIIVAHNHPSGQLEPSSEDLAVTQRLHEAGQLLGIPLLDHVIVSTQSHFSFREQHLL
jgi:DNA repair protein RadC